MMAAVQFMCAKIGMVTGRGLGGVLEQHYPAFLTS
jgi:Mn2+/Fe2+ NRAMP family transporter